jgi:hypothetical protein
MAMNPMQRKANNSFLLGILITLLITGAIIAFLIFQVMDLNKTIEEQEAALTKVYVLKSNVKSGQIITNDMLKTLDVFTSTVPQNAIGDVEVLNSYFLADEQGNQAYTGFRFKDPTNALGTSTVKDGDGFIIYSEADYNAIQDDTKNKLTEVENTQYITRQMIVGNNTMNVNCEIKFDDEVGGYYILIPETTDQSITEATRYNYTKEMLEAMPLIAKIDMYANTVITPDMVAEGQLTRDDVRKQEYNIISLPTQIQTGDYVDIRLRLPDGQDLIVVSHKEVEIPVIEEVDSTNCIWMDLTEDEILTLSCAIVESYEMNGAKLYATRYVDPGLQNAAEETYIPNASTMALIRNDPNIVETAKAELVNRYNNDIASGNDKIVRESIDDATTYEDPEEAKDLVTDKTEEEITSLQDAREEYIDSLV